MPVKKRIVATLFWSVIAAAFIGPGTLVTASVAGSRYGLDLLWTLAFATIACIIFQEMAARLTLVTGKDLAATFGRYRLKWLISIIPFSVILGCVAYEAGNLQGAAIGLDMLFPELSNYSFLIVGVGAIILLLVSSFKRLVYILGELVALMGIAFLIITIRIAPPIDEILEALFVPGIPEGSDWLVLGLIGTTVVPYNLFLGSGISKDTTIGLMRFGLVTSIILGGLISASILITGTLMQGSEGLQDLVEVARSELGYVW
ncbi:MAG: Nramp family divalent metal transporter [Cyclobacteriaceae bacterium]